MKIKKIVGLGALVAVLCFIGKTEFSSTVNFLFVVGCVLAMVPVTLVGRDLLDRNPAKVSRVTTIVQALRVLLFGIAITKAIKTSDDWIMGLALPVPSPIGLAVLILTGLALAFTMLNLALSGLGGPALASSLKLATGWMYKYIRNPMVLAMFTWLIAWGLYLQSGAFIVWVLLLVVPVEVMFEKLYEERELEIRFGESYLAYKANTPFMFPRLGFFELLGKTVATAGKHISLFALAGLFLAIATVPAFAANWVEIPFSRGGAYIDTDVRENQGIMVFWFLSRKVLSPSGYQAELTSKADSWTYEGKPFATCLRKVEVNFSKTPREVRSAFAVYFDENGEQVGRQEVTQSDWVAESGPRLWADLMRAVLSKEAESTEEIPPIAPIVLVKK